LTATARRALREARPGSLSSREPPARLEIAGALFHFEPGEGRVQLFFAVCAMKPLNCGKTFVPLQVGHFGFAFSRSAIVMMSSKGFLHFSQRNS
jgi:hypothetical protein